MEDTSTPTASSLLSSRGTGGSAGTNSETSDVVTQRCTTEIGSTTEILKGTSVDDCSLTYSSTTSGSSADTTITISADYGGSRTSLWAGNEVSTTSFSSFGSSASLSCSDISSLARADKNLSQSLEASARLAVAVSAGTSSRQKDDYLSACSGSGGTSVTVTPALVEQQQHLQEKQEQQLHIRTVAKEVACLEPGGQKGLSAGGIRPRDFACETIESHKPRRDSSDSNWRAGRSRSGKVEATGGWTDASWRSPVKQEYWRTSRNETTDKKEVPGNIDSSSLFCAQLEKAMANLASVHMGSAGNEQTKNTDSDSGGLKHFATEIQRMTNRSALTGVVPAGSEDSELTKPAGRSNGGRMEPAVRGAGRNTTTPGMSQNAYGRSRLLPPEIMTQEYIKRPTSAPPTLSKFSASTLFAFPPYESGGNDLADANRDNLYQILRELCQNLPVHPSPRESTFPDETRREIAEGDEDLTSATGAAAASLLREQQGKLVDRKHDQEWLQGLGQKVVSPPEQQTKADQRQLAVAAMKLGDAKQIQRPTTVPKRANDDRVSLAVAAVAAALLRESQPIWREDIHGNLRTLAAGASSANRAGLQALCTSTSGEGSLSSASITSTMGTETPREPEHRRLPNDCAARKSRSLQPTTLAATAPVATKGGKQDFAVSLSVSHSPGGLSSMLSSPCSSKPPTGLLRSSADHTSGSSSTNLLDTSVAETTGCFGRSRRECSGEPRILHEHHRLLLSLPQDCDGGSETLKGSHTFGTTPRITVVKIDDEKQSNSNTTTSKVREGGFSPLDAAARVLVSAATGSKAEMLLQQLESEEREVFRCASAPPAETAASLLCPAEFRPHPPNVQAGTGRVDADKQEKSFLHENRTMEHVGSGTNPGKTCSGSTPPSQGSQHTLGAVPACTGQRNSVCVLEEDVAATLTGDLFNEGRYVSFASALSAPTTQQVGAPSAGVYGANGTELQPQRPEGGSQAEPDDSAQTRGACSGSRVSLNPRVDAPVVVDGGIGAYPPLYNSQTVIPGHQFCVPPTTVPGCWEEDQAALFVPRRGADVGGAMTAAYGPSSPHSGVFLGHPPVVIPLGTSTAAEIQQQAMRAAAGAFFLQHQSAAVAAAAAAAHRGNSHEWTRSAIMQPLGGAAGERTAAPMTAQPAAPLQLDFLRGGLYYGGAGTCYGVGGFGLASGYPSGDRYFPDPLAAAATFAAMDSYNWARVNSFPGGPVGYHDGHSFGGGSADVGTANARDGPEDVSRIQQLQQPLHPWPADESDSAKNVPCSGEHTGPASSRTTRTPRLNSVNCATSQAREPSTEVDMAAEKFFDKTPNSAENRHSRGEWTTSSCDRSGDRLFSGGASAAGSTCPRGKHARSGLLGNREEQTVVCQVQIGTEPTLTRDRFKGHVVALARHQVGCRLLQRVIGEGGDPADVQIIYEELLEDAAELMLDPFGNYLVQKVLDALSEDQFRVYLTRASPQLIKASLSTHGTRAVQKVVEVIAKQVFVDAVEPALSALVRDTNANHVIQKALTTLPPSCCEFIFSHVEAHCVAICKERHGCCVVQRCIDAAGSETKKRLLAIISSNALELVQDSFGNYVVQYVLELHLPCLVHGSAGHVRAIVEELLEGGEDKFRDILVDQYGNYGTLSDLVVRNLYGRRDLRHSDSATVASDREDKPSCSG